MLQSAVPGGPDVRERAIVLSVLMDRERPLHSVVTTPADPRSEREPARPPNRPSAKVIG